MSLPRVRPTSILFEPATTARLAAGAMTLTLAAAIYCAGLWALSNGATAWPLVAFWSLATVLPWYIAYEANKHVLRLKLGPSIKWPAIALVLGVTLAACGIADWSLARRFGHFQETLRAVHIYRHLPETIAIAFLTIVASTFAARPVCSLENERTAELPIPPDRIKLVRGAGNYAELEAAERTLLLRATLSQVEALLAAHGFVRISRSIIIPKRRIAAMETRGGRRVVRLIDGSEHRVGSTFSAQLRLAGIGPS
jgi:DNA-binding LytR/AlgR family response regulator